jgi:hypothetical protein
MGNIGKITKYLHILVSHPLSQYYNTLYLIAATQRGLQLPGVFSSGNPLPITFLEKSRRLPMGKAQSGVTLVGRHWIFKSLQIQLLMHNSIVFSRQVLRASHHDDYNSNQDHDRTIAPIIVEVVWPDPGT